MTIRQEIELKAQPAAVFAALTLSEKFEKATNAPAEIDKKKGGAFSGFGGQITGRIIDLEENAWLIQAWRVGAWPEDVYSLVKFTLSPTDGGTKLALEQSGYPEEAKPHLEAGWDKMYWQPLKAFLG